MCSPTGVLRLCRVFVLCTTTFPLYVTICVWTLQIVSNGEYRSVQHRVLANSHKEPRVSIVHWFDVGNWGDSDEHGPLTELISQEKPARYRRFTKKEYVENFYSKGLDSKSLVEKLKLWIPDEVAVKKHFYLCPLIFLVKIFRRPQTSLGPENFSVLLGF